MARRSGNSGAAVIHYVTGPSTNQVVTLMILAAAGGGGCNVLCSTASKSYYGTFQGYGNSQVCY
jgi:hypothetical protein